MCRTIAQCAAQCAVSDTSFRGLLLESSEGRAAGVRPQLLAVFAGCRRTPVNISFFSSQALLGGAVRTPLSGESTVPASFCWVSWRTLITSITSPDYARARVFPFFARACTRAGYIDNELLDHEAPGDLAGRGEEPQHVAPEPGMLRLVTGECLELLPEGPVELGHLLGVEADGLTGELLMEHPENLLGTRTGERPVLPGERETVDDHRLHMLFPETGKSLRGEGTGFDARHDCSSFSEHYFFALSLVLR